MYQRESWTTFSVHAYTYVKVELDYICMLAAMQFDNLIIFLVLLNIMKKWEENATFCFRIIKLKYFMLYKDVSQIFL